MILQNGVFHEVTETNKKVNHECVKKTTGFNLDIIAITCNS